VLPKGRVGAGDLFGELVPAVLDGMAKVEVGEVQVGAALPRIGDVTEDACEAVQDAPPAAERHRAATMTSSEMSDIPL
jgi:hypothetical protein